MLLPIRQLILICSISLAGCGISVAQEPELPSEPTAEDATVESTLLPIEPIKDEQAGASMEDFSDLTKASEEMLSPLPSRFSAKIGAGVYTDSNIFLRAEDPISDVGIQHTASAGYDLRDSEKLKLSLSYLYGGHTLLGNPEANSYSHAGGILSELKLDRTSIELNAGYTYFKGIDRKISIGTDRNSANALLMVTRELGSKLNFKIGGKYDFSGNKDLLSTQDVGLRSDLNYLIGSKTRLGLGVVYGKMVTTDPDVSQAQITATQTQADVSQLTLSTGKQIALRDATALRNAADQARANAAASQAKLVAVGESNNVDSALQDKLAAEAAKFAQDATAADAAADSAGQVAEQKSAQSTKTPDQSYLQLLLTGTYEATGKLSFSADAGLDIRTYTGAEATDSSANPTYTIRGNYQPREKTRVTLSATRGSVGAVSVQGAGIQRTAYDLGIEQRIGNRFVANVNARYEKDAYESLRTDVLTNRVDEFWSAKFTLQYLISKHAAVSVYVESDIHSSAEKLLTYDSTRYGIQLGYTF